MTVRILRAICDHTSLHFPERTVQMPIDSRYPPTKSRLHEVGLRENRSLPIERARRESYLTQYPNGHQLGILRTSGHGRSFDTCDQSSIMHLSEFDD